MSDSVFSMDGDTVDLDGLLDVCRRRHALLVLDEAHAVLGPHVPLNLDGVTVLRVGTLSKSLGSLGGWVAGDAAMIDLLVNRARTYIFTTALSPADTAAGLAALGVLRSTEGMTLLAALRDSVDRLRRGHPSPIVPIVLGDETAALAAAADLFERGILIPAIRPPTVPPGTSRLRIALSAAHNADMLDALVHALNALGLIGDR